MKKIAKLALAAVVASFTMAAQANLLIDNFNIPIDGVISDQTADGYGSAASQGSIAGPIGGYRDLFLSNLNNGTAIGSSAQSVFGPNGGTLNLSTPAKVTAEAIIRWDGGAGSTAVAGTLADGVTRAGFQANGGSFGNNQNLNLCLYCFGNAFSLDLVGFDLGFEFTMNIYSDAGSGNYALSSLSLVSGTNAGVHQIEFALFNAGEGFNVPGLGILHYGAYGAADLSAVTSMEVVINNNIAIPGAGPFPTLSVDLSIDEIKVVPEPGSLALVGAALLGLAAARRRKSA